MTFGPDTPRPPTVSRLARPQLHQSMVSVDELRNWALALPGVEEAAQFGLPVFSVAGERFLGVEKSRTTAVVAVDEWEAGALVAGHQTLYEEVWHNETEFIGLRIDLGRAPEPRLRELVVAGWRNKAPEELLELLVLS